MPTVRSANAATTATPKIRSVSSAQPDPSIRFTAVERSERPAASPETPDAAAATTQRMGKIGSHGPPWTRGAVKIANTSCGATRPTPIVCHRSAHTTPNPIEATSTRPRYHAQCTGSGAPDDNVRAMVGIQIAIPVTPATAAVGP